MEKEIRKIGGTLIAAWVVWISKTTFDNAKSIAALLERSHVTAEAKGPRLLGPHGVRTLLAFPKLPIPPWLTDKTREAQK